MQGGIQLFQCGNFLLRCLLDQNQQQLGSGQGIGAGVVALHYTEPEKLYPVIHPRLAHAMLGIEHRRHFGQIEKRVPELITEKILQFTLQQALVKIGMEGHQRAVANKVEKIQQRGFRAYAGGQLAGRDLVNQHRLVNLDLAAFERAFELLSHMNGAALNRDCTNTEDLVATGIQPGGLQVDHDKALRGQRLLTGHKCRRHSGQPLQIPRIHLGLAPEPLQQAHSWYRSVRLLWIRWA